MTREYSRVQEFYLQMHELQPPLSYHHFDLHGSVPGASPGYELTAGAGSAGGEGAVPHAPHALPHPPAHVEPRKRKPPPYSEGYELSSCELGLSVPPAPAAGPPPQPASATRKRKPSSYSGTTYDDDGGEDARSSRTLPDKKQNHSEIEKRRRDKMNTYISELSAMVPMCGAMARKLDKLTVLRMAVQHLRSVRGALSAGPLAARPRPAFLSERELNALLLRAAHDCFLMVVGCDRGRLLYVSASVTRMLHYDQSELLGQSLFDILNPKDVSKVKEQLSSSDLSPRERLIDAKTMLPVKADVVSGASRLCPGARRSFCCRIKCRQERADEVKEEDKARKKANERKYCVVQCTGYLKSWAPAEMSECGGGETGAEDEACTLSCLVAVGRALPAPAPPAPPAPLLQFVSRHAPDGKFLFVDQRVTMALGFLPQELLGTSLYEYVWAGELGAVARTHKAALLRRSPARSPPYCFRRKDGLYARLATHFKPFRNPWTKDVESLVANNTVVAITAEPPTEAGFDDEAYKNAVNHTAVSSRSEGSEGLTEADVEMQRLIDSQLESHKVGSTIAEEALRRSSADFSPDLPADLLQDALFGHQSSLVDSVLGAELGAYGAAHVRNNVPLSAAGAAGSPPPQPAADGPMPAAGPAGTPPPASPPLPIDGNGEAAMAVIMSLLEADAGLGGPVNFSGLPWPLP
ncbi:protein cycle isoform X1 [Colias croceus]|uniref:protein cycle isoform X1 n=1 Tax=Colias crocea TaxID=72248 RepID=UPI001E27C67A|nr:protein cycle isoform X1 [Colias croceus]